MPTKQPWRRGNLGDAASLCNTGPTSSLICWSEGLQDLFERARHDWTARCLKTDENVWGVYNKNENDSTYFNMLNRLMTNVNSTQSTSRYDYVARQSIWMFY